jgi:putative acetyltransferase
MEIRPEKPNDAPAVRRVNEAAFGQPDEADLVDRLRDRATSYLALVAVDEDTVIGHIAFSPATTYALGARTRHDGPRNPSSQ